MTYKTFEVKCLKCNSHNVKIVIEMYDSCDIRYIECLNCNNMENWD